MKKKILYIDDDKIESGGFFDIDYVMTVSSAFNKFADEYVYDIVSLDGRMPFQVLPQEMDDWYDFLNTHKDIISRNKFRNMRELESQIHAGIYLLFLMKQFNYIPKVIILHSGDTFLKFIMEDIISRMYYQHPIVISYMDKQYIRYEDSILAINQALSKQEELAAKTPDPSTYFVKLQKGKNYFLITPNGIHFFKKDTLINKSKISNFTNFIKDKQAEGYSITHGEEYLVWSDMANVYTFKCLPVHF